MNTRVLIFDFDGVLVDLEPLHCKAWQQVLTPLNLGFSEEDYQDRYLGLNDRDFLSLRFQEAKKAPMPKLVAELIRQKESTTRTLFIQEIPLVDGVVELVEKVYKKYPLCIVSGGLPSEIYYVLDRLQWRHFFQFVITSADVEQGKPSPEGFLKAYEKFKTLKNWDPPLQPSDCLVFEDSRYGIEAAKRAGMSLIVIKKSLKPAQHALGL